MQKSKFQFSNARITKNIFIANREVPPYNNEQYNVNVKCTVEEGERENNSCYVELTVRINTSEEKMLENRLPFYIEITNMAHFTWDENMDEKHVDGLLQVNAPALLLSYLRPHIMYNTTQAGFPPYELPFIDFTKKQ